MHTHQEQKGFSFTEVLVVIAIILILAAVAIVTFKNLEISSSHRSVAQEIFSVLTDARNRSIASDGDTVYGVHFATSSVTLFEGDTYTPSDPNNLLINFTGGVYATSSLIETNTDVVFKRLTGFPTATGTLLIVRSDGLATKTITIHGSGLIEN